MKKVCFVVSILAVCLSALIPWAVAGKESSNGEPVRYWAPFKKTPINYDYVTGVCREDGMRYFMCCSDFKHPNQGTICISFPPGGEKDLKRIKILFSSKLIDDVMDPKNPGKKAPCIQMARTSMYYDKETGYVCMNSVFPGQVRDYASRTLVPALFSSKTGEPDTWTYHGKLKGEPAAYEESMKRRWIGDGSIVRVAEGRWRVYLSGYGVPVTAAESASLDGPWQFIKDVSRKIVNILPLSSEESKGICFPYVLKVSDSEYHLWVSLRWPTGPVVHFTSPDGLAFKPYGTQPEVSAAAVGARSMKGVRAFLGSDGKAIHGLIPFGTGKGWCIYQSTMLTGLQPAAP